MELVERPTFKGNGMALDNDGNVLVCEQVSSCLVRLRDSRREVLAFPYRGKYLNSPNDVVTRGSDGSIYFSDPDGGRTDDIYGQQRSRDLPYQGVYRLPPGGGELELVVAEDEFEIPNGLCFSPDESLFYINDSHGGKLKAFDVAADGSLGNPRMLHEGIGSGRRGESNADGMECDERGNIWVAGPGGVWVIAPDGERLGIVETPEACRSLSWGGGDELHTLFLTTTTTVHAVKTRVAPAPLPPF
jgi:gluconolactonase